MTQAPVTWTVETIATELGAEAAGDLSLAVVGLAEPASAAADELALAMEPKYAENLSKGSAQVAILWEGADWQALGLKAAIFAPRSRYVLSGATHVFEKKPEIAVGIHPTAVIDPSAEIGANAAIGPFVVVGASAQIGQNARIDGQNIRHGHEGAQGASQFTSHRGTTVLHFKKAAQRTVLKGLVPLFEKGHDENLWFFLAWRREKRQDA